MTTMIVWRARGRCGRVLLALGLITSLVACSTSSSGRRRSRRSPFETKSEAPEPRPEPKTAYPEAPATRTPKVPQGQSKAASTLVEQGKRYFDRGNLNLALSRLELAISINSRDGRARYWLAEVFIARGDTAQAFENHRLAARYLAGQSRWTDRLARQRQTIDELRTP